MANLPDEIWSEVLDYLDPYDIVSTQRVSSRMLELARDTRLWRYKCFEKAPSAAKSLSDRPNALSALTGALGGLSLDDQTQPAPQADLHHAGQQGRLNKRARAVAEWDCSDPDEHLDWYSEYMGRHAPLSVDWAITGSNTAEVRGMALFNDGSRVVAPLSDGGLFVWNIEHNELQQPQLRKVATSEKGLLFQDLSVSPESSTGKSRSLGHAVDNVALDPRQNRAYVSAESSVNEVDLERLTVISQHQYAWPVTALSRASDDHDFNLTVGTSWSLHIHDPRMRPGHPISSRDVTSQVDHAENDPNIAFLPNFSKLENHGDDSNTSFFGSNLRNDIQAYARVEPGPQSILHRGRNEIIIAGRMPSILFYDRRFFPRLKSSIHSGARLSSMTTLPFPPTNDARETKDQNTLIACGEYGGCGSLEIYGLSDDSGFEEDSFPQGTFTTNEAYQQIIRSSSSVSRTQSGFSFKNRQSASTSKLLSVCTQGARILFSDAEGQLKWVERDGRGIARRWNINAASYSYSIPKAPLRSSLPRAPINARIRSSADVVRKMIPMPPMRSGNNEDSQTTRGDSDILVWSGEKIGIVTCKPRPNPPDSIDDLEDTFDGNTVYDSASEEERRKEKEYARQMRRALERQADERRWMSKFGGRWR